jgi:hypothetical protein
VNDQGGIEVGAVIDISLEIEMRSLIGMIENTGDTIRIGQIGMTVENKEGVTAERGDMNGLIAMTAEIETRGDTRDPIATRVEITSSKDLTKKPVAKNR